MKEEPESIIEQFIEGKLSPEAAVRFQKQLESDPTLQHAYDTERAARLLIALDRETRIREMIRKAAQPEPLRRFTWQNGLAVAASVGILLVFAFLLQNRQPAGPQALFMAYYSPYPNTLSVLGPGDTLQQAMSLYDAGNYSKALDLFQQLKPGSPEYTAGQLYTAICAIEVKNWALAAELLIPLAEKKDPAVSEVGKWYLALSYLEQGKLDLARPIFQALRDEGVSKYGGMSANILRQIRE